MHLAIRYSTRFDYPEPVRQSHNELRAAPTSDLFQQLLFYRVTTVPAARTFTYLDYFGTLVDAFGIRYPHDHLDVEVEAVVETEPNELALEPIALAHLADPRFRDRSAEYLAPSPHVIWGEGTAALAAEARAEAGDAAELVHRICDLLTGRIEYRSGATSVGEAVEDVLTHGTGVCQDYAHTLIAVCRSQGIPARYVSGYLFAVDDASGGLGGHGPDEPIEVQTHAWVEVKLPRGEWVPIDPTNRQPVQERHVKIGHGRDYGDVAPLHGVYTGGGVPELRASVQMRRVSAPERGLPLAQQRIQLQQQQQQEARRQQQQQQQ